MGCFLLCEGYCFSFGADSYVLVLCDDSRGGSISVMGSIFFFGEYLYGRLTAMHSNRTRKHRDYD